MRRSDEFSRAFKGSRAGSSRVLVAIGREQADNVADLPPKVGFVVPKSVGNSVVRHRVYRQLRHILRERLDRFCAGELVVVRAFPGAHGARSTELSEDVDRLIDVVRRKAEAK